jgi:hypothetical protein
MSSELAARDNLLFVEFASHMSNLNTHRPHFTAPHLEHHGINELCDIPNWNSVVVSKNGDDLNYRCVKVALTSRFNAVPARNAEMYFQFNYLQGDPLGGDPELIITKSVMIYQCKQQ